LRPCPFVSHEDTKQHEGHEDQHDRQDQKEHDQQARPAVASDSKKVKNEPMAAQLDAGKGGAANVRDASAPNLNAARTTGETPVPRAVSGAGS
jgi:hypothetical protein